MVRLREGPETPPGTKILHLRAEDDDGDQLVFGISGIQAEDVLRIENHQNQEASVFLNRVLDAEVSHLVHI